MIRRWWVVLPVVLGAVATGVALAAGDARTIVAQTAVAWLWVVLGLAASAVLVVVLVVRRRIELSREEGRAAAAAEQRENQARFLARLDHELKNPLTAILAGVSNLDASEPAVSSIQTQAARLSRLLTDLRKLGELRTVALELAPVDLEALCAEVVDALPDADDRVVTVTFPRAPRPLPQVLADTDLIFLALFNLLSNAVKYSSAGDTIEVRGSERDGVAVVEIADTGMGVPEDEREFVWEELSRGRSALGIPGSGLGLPFVRAIIERHGGDVELRSRAGEGTLVRVTLPFDRR